MAIVTAYAQGGATGVLLNIKAVPGAKRDELAGRLGDRLKVRVTAPPEGGKANKAICELLADALGVKTNVVSVVRGHTSADKTVQIQGVSTHDAESLL